MNYFHAVLRHSVTCSLLCLPSILLAEDVASSQQRIDEAERRIERLEAQQDQNKHFDGINFAGLVEIEAIYRDPDEGKSESELALATAELALSAIINEQISVGVAGLYEDDGEQELDIDVAAVFWNVMERWAITAGQFYLPFGQYNTAMLSDPLTLELGEIRETAVMAEYKTAPLRLSVFVFDGDVSESEAASIDNIGLALDSRWEISTATVDVHLAFINDLQESDTQQEFVTTPVDRVAATDAAISVGYSGFTLYAEAIKTLDTLPDGSEPSAYSIQLSYAFEAVEHEIVTAIGDERSVDAELYGLAEEIQAVSAWIEISRNTRLGFEIAAIKEYSGDRISNVSTQLRVEF